MVFEPITLSAVKFGEVSLKHYAVRAVMWFKMLCQNKSILIKMNTKYVAKNQAQEPLD